MDRRVAIALAAALVCNAAGCASAGSSATIPAASGNTLTNQTGNVRFTLMIPSPSIVGSAKHRAFVSSSANGALVTTYAHSDTTHSTPLGSSASNISSTGSACTTVSGGRNCTITIVAPAGDDDFVFGLYDAAPVNGAIPSTAHELGIAGVTQTIVAGTTNTVSAAISAIIAGFNGSTTNVNEAADGNAHTVALVISPTDFGDNAITAGAANAPYANPITATVSDGSKGYTLLSLNGGTPAATVTLTKATDTVQAVYNGGGTSGYTATVNLTAPQVNGQGGATIESLTITPILFVTNNSPAFYSSSPATLNTYPEGQHVLLIAEPTAPGTTTYTAMATGCTNILGVGTVVGKGTNATVLVVGGTSPSSSGCSLAISDGTLTFPIAVTNKERSGPSGTPVINEYTTAAQNPQGIVTGADGNLWFTEQNAPAISSIKSDGTGYTAYPLGADSFVAPLGDALGPDGNVWFGDENTNLVGKITTSGTPAVTAYSDQTAVGTLTFTAGLDGNIWFSEYCNPSTFIGNIASINTTTDALNAEIPVPNGGNPQPVALGPDGNIWYGDSFNDVIGYVSGGVATSYPTLTNEIPLFMTAGSDGEVWFSEDIAFIQQITTAGAMTPAGQYQISPTTPLNFITAGPDGALWFADAGNKKIGRMSTNGTFVEYSVPSGGTPQGITVGPDGNIWFTEDSGKIGVLVL
jgi:streptogramin lyase